MENFTNNFLKPEVYIETYKKIALGTEMWNNLQISNENLFQWNEKSTYIRNPLIYNKMNKELP